MKEWIKEHWKECVLFAIVIFLVVLLCKSYTNNKNQKDITNTNITALTDTIEYYKCKNGEIAVEKSILVGDIEVLKQVNKDLFESINNMKAENAKLVTRLEFAVNNVKHDTCWMIEKDTVIQHFDFNFNDKPYRKLSGCVNYCIDNIQMRVDTDIVYANLDVAVEDNIIKVNSNNPYLEFNDIYGITLPKYEPSWCLVVGPSIQAGYGYGTNFNGGNCPGGLVVSAGISLTFGWNIVGVGKRVKK